VVLAAKEDSLPAAADALAQLCRAYWYPLYVFIRRRGHGPHDAQDLTQEFFYRLLDKRYLSAVDHRKGRFRTFLLAALEHFLANEWRRSQTQRRGGGQQIISIDDSAEQRYSHEPVTELSPERIYEQRWALAFLEQVLVKLRAEFVEAGKGETFEATKAFLTGDRSPVGYADLAASLGTTEAALKMAVSRMRQRYAELLRQEIANTVASPDEIEDELRALMAALS
jgi:RNA polymerase sigma-70 factor (ECF subfamily)